jgi:hypothetical protein
MTELCIKNLSAVLTEAGSSIEKVVKVNVFLTSMDYFAEMNSVYEKLFKHKPARSKFCSLPSFFLLVLGTDKREEGKQGKWGERRSEGD